MIKSFPSLNLTDLPKKYLILAIGLALIFLMLFIFTDFFTDGEINKEDKYLNYIANKTPEIEKEIYLQSSALGVNVGFVEVLDGNVTVDITVQDNIISKLNYDVVNVLYLVHEKYPELKQITVRVARLLENSKENAKVMCVVFADAEDIEKVKLKYQQPQEVDIIKCFETWLDPSLLK